MAVKKVKHEVSTKHVMIASLGLFAFIALLFSQSPQQAFRSSEVGFVENSRSGLGVVPASCELGYEHTARECDPGDPPAAPTVIGASGVCITGQPYTISMFSTDPDGDQLRYAIDWDANGVVDQLVPSSGYVNSGTTLTANHTFPVSGTYYIRVLAQDNYGLTSAWTTHAVACSDDGTGTIDPGDTPPPIGPVDLLIRAIPELVRNGATTQIHWSASGIVSCSVSGENGDFFTGTFSPADGETSSPITEQTTYTLTCLDTDDNPYTADVDVNIVPVFQEI